MKKLRLLIPVITAINFWINYSLDTEKVNLSFQKAEAAWWEFGEAAEEYEYAVNTSPCAVEVYVCYDHNTQIGVHLDPPSIQAGSSIHYEVKTVAGSQQHCIDGKEYKDCSDAIGAWDSILGDGDCVPN